MPSERFTVGFEGLRKLVLAAVLPAVALTGCVDSPPDRPPNVVLIVVDTLRADHLSHYGYERPTAIALDGFASQATRFTDCTAPAPWTNPSVASLFSGMETARHGSNDFGAAISTDVVTLAEVIQTAGWHTAAISFNPGIRSELDFHQGFDHFNEYLGKSTHSPDIAEMIDRVVRWLDSRPDKPFFLYLQPMNVHGPYRVPEEHRGVLLDHAPGTEFRYYGEAMQAIMRRGELEVRDELSSEYLQSLLDKYDTAIRYSTDRLADLFQILDDRDLFENSLVIVTSDHGEELFDHGGFSHGYSLHHEVLHVPLYVKLPNQHDGQVIESPSSLIDLLPTVLDVLGLDDPIDRDGRSLMPTILGTHKDNSKFRIYQTNRRNRCIGRAIDSRRFKLIEIKTNYEGIRDEVRLFDLSEDPGERSDLASERPDTVHRLLAELEERFAAASNRAVAPPENRIDRLDHERLRALGYIDDTNDRSD
jgi:arylsulfatase A-like enzyme